MKYCEELVLNICTSQASGRCLEKIHNISRKTIYRWRKRHTDGLSTRLKRVAKTIYNKLAKPIMDQIQKLLIELGSTIQTWVEIGITKISLRTIQRYSKKWFPKIKTKKIYKRYVRRKIHSLFHTDWATQRIKNGDRCCFSFYLDDASRKMFALKAYPIANKENTVDNLLLAKKQAGNFKAVLSDNGRVYLSKIYKQELDGIKHIRTRPHNPRCNGKAEAAVKKIKGYLRKFKVEDLKHANEILKEYQKIHNDLPHTSLKYLSPNKIYNQKLKSGDISAVM